MFMYLFLFAFLHQVSSTPTITIPEISGFSFPYFTTSSCSDGTLICTGSVTSRDGFLTLTPEAQLGHPVSTLNQVGRVLYRYPVHAWPAVIDTTFTFRIITSGYSIGSADGLTFIMAPTPSPSPSNSYGSYLGIMDPIQEGHAAGQLAVEFDTYKNTYDLDGNHVAIDTRSVIYPVRARSLNYTGIDLKSGRDIKVRIQLDGRTNFLRVYIGYASDPKLTYFLADHIDIPYTLPSSIFVGFTASTGSLTERHEVTNWKLTSVPIVI